MPNRIIVSARLHTYVGGTDTRRAVEIISRLHINPWFYATAQLVVLVLCCRCRSSMRQLSAAHQHDRHSPIANWMLRMSVFSRSKGVNCTRALKAVAENPQFIHCNSSPCIYTGICICRHLVDKVVLHTPSQPLQPNCLRLLTALSLLYIQVRHFRFVVGSLLIDFPGIHTDNQAAEFNESIGAWSIVSWLAVGLVASTFGSSLSFSFLMAPHFIVLLSCGTTPSSLLMLKSRFSENRKIFFTLPLTFTYTHTHFYCEFLIQLFKIRI